jgi:hypothetical protein
LRLLLRQLASLSTLLLLYLNLLCLLQLGCLRRCWS